MDLRTFLQNNGWGAQIKLSREINISISILNEWVSGKRPIPLKRCVQIEKTTNGAVTRKDLRPDDWIEIWPELAEK